MSRGKVVGFSVVLLVFFTLGGLAAKEWGAWEFCACRSDRQALLMKLLLKHRAQHGDFPSKLEGSGNLGLCSVTKTPYALSPQDKLLLRCPGHPHGFWRKYACGIQRNGDRLELVRVVDDQVRSWNDS